MTIDQLFNPDRDLLRDFVWQTAMEGGDVDFIARAVNGITIFLVWDIRNTFLIILNLLESFLSSQSSADLKTSKQLIALLH